MTTVLPVQCFACARLDRSTALPVRCTAYPDRIPDDIRTFGDDHRKARGDEVDELTFLQADDGQAAFDDWQAFASASPAEPALADSDGV